MNKDGKYAYDYYIAGTDSCAGDSGGPVYRWINDTATLIAVVARYLKSYSILDKIWSNHFLSIFIEKDCSCIYFLNQ